MKSNDCGRNTSYSFLVLSIIFTINLVATAGEPAEKKEAAGVGAGPMEPTLLVAGEIPTLRFPAWCQSGPTIRSDSFGWLDVTRTAVRYTVVQPKGRMHDGFEIPMQALNSRNPGLRNGFVLMFQEERGKKHAILALREERWGKFHGGFSESSIAQPEADTPVILSTIRNFDTVMGRFLRAAARDGDSEKVRAILKDNPALALSRDDVGLTVLHLAASAGHRDVVELLLAAKADINAKDNAGETPLHLAALAGHADVVALLREHGGQE
jgi:hypothetical protein